MINLIFKRLLVCSLLYFIAVDSFAQPYLHTQNTQIPRSNITTYKKASNALLSEATLSEYYTDLTGEYRVKYYDSALDIEIEELDSYLDLEGWGEKISLPFLWQTQSSGYTKGRYPFLQGEATPGEFPIPSNSKCALYQRDFTVPFDYLDKALYLKLSGASSKATIYVNGNEIGFATDSKGVAEYDISQWIVRGQNRLSIAVEEYSGGSWLEDSDGEKLLGITGEVSMLAQPKIRIRDIIASGQLDPSYTNGLLSSALLLKTELLNPHTVTVYYTLYDTEGKITHRDSKEVSLDMRREDTVRFNTSLQNVMKWNSETPKLYTIVYSVKREGRFTEYASTKVGFRKIETKGSQLLVNGIAPTIKGVNLKTFNSINKRELNREELTNILLELRSQGINAIRTQRNSTPSLLYDLTDSLGFYVVELCNINTSGLKNQQRTGYSLANNPEWEEIFSQRVISGYEKVKHHPSVIALALGEDAGTGYNFYEASLKVKARNPELLVIYDGAGAEWYTDIVCPLFPTANDLKSLKKKSIQQPIIPSRVKLDEIDYWNTSGLQGAFIESTEYISTKQGDFKNFSCEIINAKEGLISITNFMQYPDSNTFTLRYRSIAKGKASKWKEVKAECPVGKTTEIQLSKFHNAQSLEVEISDLYKGTLENL